MTMLTSVVIGWVVLLCGLIVLALLVVRNNR
jgi:tetrahydromethanopterin S-methyltransferase subunit E